jgi:hypothetical protein
VYYLPLDIAVLNSWSDSKVSGNHPSTKHFTIAVEYMFLPSFLTEELGVRETGQVVKLSYFLLIGRLTPGTVATLVVVTDCPDKVSYFPNLFLEP